ncbi:MAG: cytochrome P450, partial [Sphingomonadales bacterium]
MTAKTMPQLSGRRVRNRSGQTIDLRDPDQHLAANLHDIYAALRTNSPVYWNIEDGGPGFWAVTRYDDVEAVLRDPATYSSDFRRGGIRIFNTADFARKPRPNLLSLDPPDHGPLRRTLNPLFNNRAAAGYASTARARARRLIGAIAPLGRTEFIAEIAAPMTAALLAYLLDIDEEEAIRLSELSEIMSVDDDPQLMPRPKVRHATLLAINACLRDLLDRPRHPDRSNLIDALTNGRIAGEPLDFEALSVNFRTLIFAATETTRHSMARMMIALSDFPEMRAALVARPDMAGIAVKEIIRWTSAAKHVRRTATRDAMLGGQAIRAGDKFVLWLEAANRDESKWDDAAALRVDRFAGPGCPVHLAFGAGIHHCLGWRFAELQLTAVLEEVLRTIPDAAVAGDIDRLRSNFIGGVKRVDLRFTPAPAVDAHAG